FVLADIAGVPDLFDRIRPVLSSLIPGRPLDPRVRELRPFARRIVTAWVVTVVPLLVLALGWMLLNLPVILEQTARAIGQHAGLAATAIGEGDLATAALAVLSIILLSLPLAGLAILLYRLLLVLITLLRRLALRIRPPRAARAGRPPLKGNPAMAL
ncbi:hypothetical protein, partial [Escherichia coli]|uniref:hypothetical protein n=1 Tax=Escherichia coli TaxID=562 RepID=UPI0032E4760D